MATVEDVTAKLKVDAGNWRSMFSGAINDLTKTVSVSVLLGNAMTKAGGLALQFARNVASFPADAAQIAGQYAEEIEHIATMTGLASTEIQEYSVLLARTGLTTQDLAVGFRSLATNIKEARSDTSQAAQAFYALGITLQGNEKPADVLRLIGERLSMLPDGFQKSALATELFGRAGQRMLVAFKDGPEALDKAAQKARDFGLVLSQDAIERLAATDDAFDDLGSAMKGFTLQVGVASSAIVEFSVTGMTRLIEKATGVVKAMNESTTAAEAFARALIELNKLSGATSALPAAPEKPKGPLAVPPGLSELDELPKKYRSVAEAQADAGNRIIKQTQVAIEIQKQLGTSFEIAYDLARGATLQHVQAIVARGKAEQAVGATQLQIIQRATVASQEAFANEFENGQLLLRLQQEKIGYLVSGQYEQAQVSQLMIEEVEALSYANTLSRSRLTIEDDIGRAIMLGSVAAYNEERTQIELIRALRDGALAKELENAQVAAKHQKALYQSQKGFLGATDKVRELSVHEAMLGFDQQASAVRDLYDDQLISQEEYVRQSTNLELERETAIRNIVAQTPTFFEEQMQALINSNTFSVAQITTTWTSGIANSIVRGGDFIKQAWQQTQVFLVQAALNTGVQLAAQAALNASVELGIMQATEAAKLGLKTASNAAIVATDAAAAGATVGIWEGAAAAIVGTFTGIGAAIAAFWVETLVPMFIAVGTAIIEFLSAVAAAMTETVFGIPIGIAILVAVGGIIAALAALGAIQFERGGIGDFGSGTPAMLHKKEAIIPLNNRGAAFMHDALGGGFGGKQTLIVPVQVDRREIGRVVVDELPNAFSAAGIPAWSRA